MQSFKPKTRALQALARSVFLFKRANFTRRFLEWQLKCLNNVVRGYRRRNCAGELFTQWGTVGQIDVEASSMTKLSQNFWIFDQLFTCFRLRWRVFSRENGHFLQNQRSQKVLCYFDVETRSERRQSDKFVEIWSNFLKGFRWFRPRFRFF